MATTIPMRPKRGPRVRESAPASGAGRDAQYDLLTAALIEEVPRIDARHRSYVPIRGEIPSPLAPPSGCHFHPRCPHAFARCREEPPELREIAPGRISACHLNDIPRS